MKHTTLIAAMGLLLSAGISNAQIVTNGDFESGSANWTEWKFLLDQNVTFTNTTDAPTGSTGNSFFIEPWGDPAIGGIYQEITLTGGNVYEVEALVRNTADGGTSWLEFQVGTVAPVNGADYTAGTLVGKIDSWGCSGYDGDLTLGCSTLNVGQFTAAGSGSVTYYLVIEAGVCCAGGTSGYTIDNIVITDLGSGVTYDTPPTPLFEDFNDGLDSNNYGGIYGGFAGGDPGGNWTAQDTSMEVSSVDAEGVTGAAGDYALRVHAPTPLTGDTYIYYGAVAEIVPTGGVPGQDISGFVNLQFDIKKGSVSSTSDWKVRLEDSSATGETSGSYNWIDIASQVTDTYQTVTIPLADFVSAADGGSTTPNLTSIDAIVFASKTDTLKVTDPFIYIDNLELTTSTGVDNWLLLD